MSIRVCIARWLAEKIAGQPVQFRVSVRVHGNDASWQCVGGASHDRDDIYEHYNVGFAINSPVVHKTGT